MKSLLQIFLIALLLFFTACSSSSDEEGNFVPLKYSDLLKIERNEEYTRVRISDPADSTKTLATYILIDRNRALPDSLPAGEVIPIPVKNLVVYSSVHASALKELDAIKTVRGIAEAGYFSIPEIKEGLKSGKIVDVGTPSSPSIEKIIELKPDAVIASIYEGNILPDLSSCGVKYLKMADNLETSPLGRAEWLRFLGMITGNETKADSIVAETVNEYNRLRDIASQAKRKPKVLTDNMYQGVWYVPAGDSYQAKMLIDAGADYPWAETTGRGSLSLSFEDVAAKASDAQIWLYKSFGNNLTPDFLLKEDERYSHFKALRDGGVWFSNTAESNLYEEFPFHPDRLLSDYIAIFHPDLHNIKPRYFKRMTSN